MIQTKNLTKVYKNGFKAVDDLNLSVEKGDIFGFLGPNGAGKTTTIRMLDGLHSPTKGTAFIAGMDITKDSEKIKRIIGVVPESHGYYYSMTAKEYLEYFSSLFNPTTDESEYIEYLLKQVGLYEKKDVVVGQFSRGMKQRLGIAKSLINHPQIIFLDEPTLGLDPRGQYDIQQLLLKINRENDITIFITSHQLKDIEVMCNKVCIVKNGKLLVQGSVEELETKYMTHYTLKINTDNNKLVGQEIAKMNNIRSVKELDDLSLEVKFKKELSESEIDSLHKLIVKSILENGYNIYEISQVKLNMEDVFFRATGGNENE